MRCGASGGSGPDRDSNPVPTSVPSAAKRREIPPPNATQDDAKRREVSASRARNVAPPLDAVEAALADAAAAGRLDVVAQLARELEARRLEPAKASSRRGGDRSFTSLYARSLPPSCPEPTRKHCLAMFPPQTGVFITTASGC